MRDALESMSPVTSREVTPNTISHSLRRGAAAYANASPKLAIQWTSTRGVWLLESLTKAFAYIGTTTKEDRSVAKVLAGYQSPDLPTSTPSIRDLQHRLSATEYGQLITLRNELYRHMLGFQDARFNVALDVVDATFASLLMHLEEVLAATTKANAIASVSRYRFQLERSLEATNTSLGSCITLRTCCSWGEHLRANWRATNHAQVGHVVAGGDSLLSSTLENMLAQLVGINEPLARLEYAYARAPTEATNGTSESSLSVSAERAIPPQLATATTLAGTLLNWYTNRMWETLQGKKEQNKRAEVKAAVNIMFILYQKPITIPQEPSRAGAAGVLGHQGWKDELWTLALAMDKTANDRLYSLDHKRPTRKASSLSKRWRQLRQSHPEAYKSLAGQYLALKANGDVVDACAPASHLWAAADLV